MKLLNATVLTLCLFASTSAQTNQGGSSMDQQIKITRNGSLTSQQGPAENFTGSVSVQYLVQPKSSARTSSALVNFQPGARTAWHTHPLGQVLIVTAGTGRVRPASKLALRSFLVSC